MKWLLYLSFLITGCQHDNREGDINARELELKQLEKKLFTLQKDLFLKEQQLIKREIIIDSINNNGKIKDSLIPEIIDTTATHSYLTGLWNVETVCTQSTCENFAVGDTKREVWDIQTQGNYVIAEVLSSNQSGRRFTGYADKNAIDLGEAIHHSDSTLNAKISIRLKIRADDNIEGERELVRENCRVLYSMKMLKQ